KHTAPLLLSQSLAPPPHATLFPYTTLFRSAGTTRQAVSRRVGTVGADGPSACHPPGGGAASGHERFNRAGAHPANCQPSAGVARSEEHTSELQSRENLVCRLLLEKKNHNST